ncbi:glutamate--cysteine ligase [Marinospirillum alkaliphilum]|uniref:Glutamate--cysteine ligase n=1 Tax=Marinospirillum alkaliphilum DSM 21637 TaxID=1122209 RepID=A0A1K1VG40_9GAMM|nr:glutamate--cysteine ligase [Marinospirillum alkaliphilum]SFX24118.1 glutamate-cysteine ligase [Marinospirillum alkaliphilum DSM 21637]
MTQDFSQRLSGLQTAAEQGLFNSIRRGLEKETLRTTPQGDISQTAHPKALGSTLTHPHITTDYSEALLEFITPVCSSCENTLDFLLDLHRFSLQRLEQQELLWPASMPCRLNGNNSVRIAEYGNSNVGRMKHVYRRGLDWRYGRIMQSIAGLHYNVSFPDALWPLLAELDGLPATAADDAWRSERYFGLIRNFRRHSWLLIYLFGASPALDESFLNGRTEHPLQPLAPNTWGAEQATSLRMSDLGYQNKVQASLKVCFNSLDNYIKTLHQAIHTRHPDYEKIGVKVDGEYRQLNANILQIENEYYSDIRPKRVARSGQKPSQALQEKGVEYIEVRCLDINPFLPGGIDVAQMHFLDAFLLFCLLQDSPPLSDADCRAIDSNLQSVVNHGRNTGTLINNQRLQQAASELLQQLHPVCQLLDLGTPEATPFCDALNQQQTRVDDPALTPSARMLQLVRECGGHIPAVLELARAQREQLLANPINPARQAQLEALSRTSLEQQQAIEAADQVDFDTYLQQYFAT